MSTPTLVSIGLFLLGIAWFIWAPDSEEERTKEPAP